MFIVGSGYREELKNAFNQHSDSRQGKKDMAFGGHG